MGYQVVYISDLGQGVVPDGVPTYGLYMEISAWEITDEIRWASKVTPYVHHLPCGAGGWLWESKIGPG
eukprot:11539883-Ditylum_brightwellii.AAC.1